MAVTQNTYTGNGSTVLFSFTFPYLETTDIKVSLNGTVATAYTLANATTIQFNTAPANGAVIRIYRDTDDSSLPATFFPGSAIRSQDLNDNFTQTLYISQETSNTAVQDVGDVTLAANYTFVSSPSGPTPTSSSNLTTKAYVDTLVTNTAFTSGNLSVGDKGDLTVNSASSWTIDPLAVTTAKIADSNVTYGKIQNISTTNRILGRSTAGAGVIEEIICTAAGRALLDDADATAQRATLGVPSDYTITTTAVSKTLVNRERCVVTAAGQTLTLPATPSPGWEVSVTIAGSFTNTLIARNGSPIMSLAEDITLNTPNATVALVYIDTTRGWRIF
jgi:hypothetical protein